MIDKLVKEAEPKMKSAIEKFVSDLSKVRTGRANPAILDNVMISYYGATTPVRELATISVPEPNQISVKPWDRNALADIELGIRNSDIGLSPINDGTQVRLILPPMTEERRKELATQVKKMGEDAKVVLRNIRREVWDQVQAAEKKNEATEDDRRWAEVELNKLVEKMNKEAEKVVADKETEIMRI